MKNQSQKLTDDIKKFLAKNRNKKEPITDPEDLATVFLNDFPEYREDYGKEIITSQIDLTLSTTIL